MKISKKAIAPSKVKGHILIVEARYYEGLGHALAEGAESALIAGGASFERLNVPGALEIPGAIALAAKSKRYDGFVALGCVIRGETSHYDIVSNESARGLMDLTLQGLCIGNGILTCENEEQAWARARKMELDKGGGAAQAVLAMLHVKRLMAKRKTSKAKRAK